MIHVCRVDIGSRHVFDSADGINDVGSLIAAIEHNFKIDKSKQILLISGGEILNDHQQKLYRLSAGREESPIYLIDINNVEKEQAPVVETPLNNFTHDLKQEIKSSMQLMPCFQTLQHRSQISYRVYELGKQLHKLCQSFYDDQYWQYQGFLALIANLDDYINSFRKRYENIRTQFDTFTSNQHIYKKLCNEEIDNYVELLSNIPLIPQIHKNLFEQKSSLDNSTASNIKNASNDFNQIKSKDNSTNLGLGVFNNISTQSICTLAQSPTTGQDLNIINDTFKETGDLNKDSFTLLDWIKSTDTQNKLNNVIDDTREMLKNMEQNLKWQELDSKILKFLNQIDSNPQMKDIEGLTKRLQDLTAFLDKSNKLLNSQNEIREGFGVNLERATSLRDESILQDLCKGHEVQLEIFGQNHSNMIEITNKMSKAKLELVRVIHSRLHWVMQIQKKIAELDFQFSIYYKQLKRLHLRLLMLEQLKRAPYVYFCSINETIRRKKFAQLYKSVGDVVTRLITDIYDEEMRKRSEFNEKHVSWASHFVLTNLFRSLKDKVDLFVNQSELKFDNDLPNINENDLIKIEEVFVNYLSKKNNLNNFSFKEKQTNAVEALLLNEIKSLDSSLGEPSENSFNSSRSSNLLESLNKCLENFSFDKKIEKSDNIDSIMISNIKQIIKETKIRLNQIKDDLESFKKTFDINLVEKMNIFQNSFQNKEQFYEELLAILKQSEYLQNDEIKLKTAINELDHNFSQQLINWCKTCHSENIHQQNNLKSNLELMKKNLNADKQIQFNEAIKRATIDKDKQLEEMRAKEANYLKEIESLKEQLNAKTQEKEFTDACSVITATDSAKQQEKQTSIQASGNQDEMEKAKCKLKELMLMEKITQLEKQLSQFTTLPLTNDYETIQLNSCNIDDLVIAVYNEEYSSYKIIHKTSQYLHFVHSAIFKSHEQRLSFKNLQNSNDLSKNLDLTTEIANQTWFSNNQQQNQFDLELPSPSTSKDIVKKPDSLIISNKNSTITNTGLSTSKNTTNDITINNSNLQLGCPHVVKNSPADDVDSIFLSQGQTPQWFIGRVLVKEFCIARRENNRFRVPSGTRFYRVKLKPYNL